MIPIALGNGNKSAILELSKSSFSSNSDNHYFSPADKSLERFLVYIVYFHKIEKSYNKIYNISCKKCSPFAFKHFRIHSSIDSTNFMHKP